MATMAETARRIDKPLFVVAGGFSLILMLAAIAIPNLIRSRMSAEKARSFQRQQEARLELIQSGEPPAQTIEPASSVAGSPAAFDKPQSVTTSDVAPDRRIIRTSALELVVQHPADAAEKISTLAEGLGGYVETSEGGGEDAATGTLTVRVPATKFEQARAEIRKLGVRVESDKLSAQDVTRQYVDQDARIRNLRAEEAQYLAILKQAGTVKDLLAVSDKLSEVRGQIEQQQAEFNALSKQTETVAISIALRTEAEAAVFGLNWRPAYQMRLAVRDGLEGLANYATAMAAILFYLPTVLLWVGTILAGVLISWRSVLWVGQRFFGWKPAAKAMSA